jgi:hypothetical protein
MLHFQTEAGPRTGKKSPQSHDCPCLNPASFRVDCRAFCGALLVGLWKWPSAQILGDGARVCGTHDSSRESEATGQLGDRVPVDAAFDFLDAQVSQDCILFESGKSRTSRFNECGAASEKINDECVGGGDSGHQPEYKRCGMMRRSAGVCNQRAHCHDHSRSNIGAHPCELPRRSVAGRILARGRDKTTFGRYS